MLSAIEMETAPALPLALAPGNERDSITPPFATNEPPEISTAPPCPPKATVRIFPAFRFNVSASIWIAPPMPPSGLDVPTTLPPERFKLPTSRRNGEPSMVIAEAPLRKLTSPPTSDRFAWPSVVPMTSIAPASPPTNRIGAVPGNASAAVCKFTLLPPSNSTELPVKSVSAPTLSN